MFTLYSKEKLVHALSDPECGKDCYKLDVSYVDKLRVFFGICPN